MSVNTSKHDTVSGRPKVVTKAFMESERNINIDDHFSTNKNVNNFASSEEDYEDDEQEESKRVSNLKNVQIGYHNEYEN